MIDDEDIDDFLEHHGVIGMRWGTRKSSSTSRTPEQQAKRKKNINTALKAVEIGAAVGAGAILVTHLIRKHNATKVKNITRLQSNFAQTKRLMDQVKDVHMRDLSKNVRAGKVSTANYDPLRKGLERNVAANTIRKNKAAAAEIMKQHHASARLANQQLKQWYESSRVPIHAREYMTG